MSALASAGVAFDPLRDLRHREARAARDLADWLAWLELGNKATRTLDAYERYAAALLRAFPRHSFQDFTDGDLADIFEDGAQYGVPNHVTVNRLPRPQRRKYATEAERHQARLETQRRSYRRRRYGEEAA